MKITTEKYPILEKLEKGIFGVIGMSELDTHIIRQDSDLMVWCRETFKGNIPYFKKSIKYLSIPLCEAMVAAKEKMTSTEILLQLSSCSGTFIMGDFQYCYAISAVAGSDDWNYICFFFSGNMFLGFSAEDNKQGYNYASSLITGNSNPTMEERKATAKFLFSRVILAINFLKYADIEVKNLPPSRQIYDGVNCLYNNKSKYPIEIVDSTWFTTLVKSEGFKVRGHFRLQPYGEGLSKKKLVWISEFKKDGYTRTAKKIATI